MTKKEILDVLWVFSIFLNLVLMHVGTLLGIPQLQLLAAMNLFLLIFGYFIPSKKT